LLRYRCSRSPAGRPEKTEAPEEFKVPPFRLLDPGGNVDRHHIFAGRDFNVDLDHPCRHHRPDSYGPDEGLGQISGPVSVFRRRIHDQRVGNGGQSPETRIHEGDTLLLYGSIEDIKELDQREKGYWGDREHREAVREQEKVLEEEAMKDRAEK
jgi:hypothetical protein